MSTDALGSRPLKVLIVSASMGAGHDGAARELRRRLEEMGHGVTLVDYLDAVPLRAGAVVRSSYKWQLRLAPSTYEASYQTWVAKPARAGPLAAALATVTGPALRRWIAASRPDVTVSTYPLCSLVLGRDRQRQKLATPVATFVTDFAVHPLWTHPGIDLHLTVHPQAAAEANRLSGGAATAPGPLVPERFLSFDADQAGDPARRVAARRSFGITDDERVVLLVAGSWGIGQITETFADVVATGRYTPLAICGHNLKLCRALGSQIGGRAIGWTDAMPDLLLAADVLVQNAGGLTCMEAFATGLPVISYRPIAGHGRANASEMERAGVALYAREPAGLTAALDQATGPRKRALVEAGRAMFTGDAAVEVARLGGR
ncbi:MAG: hypothetical protein M3011_00200 [Actinomycetota bacterium]|nr:hypothetical protein [Actinomycetota bacterium]